MAKIINKGRGLEKTVAEIYTDLCYTPIQSNVHIFQNSGGKRISAEIDIIYNYLSHKRYVECKYRTTKKVTLEELSKFAAVLGLFNIPLHNGEVITNYKFDNRAITYSKNTGIRLIDGDELKKLSDSRWNQWNIIKAIKISAGIYQTQGITGIMSYATKRVSSLEAQITKNSV